MSMWLDLVKIDPAVLAAVQERPQLIDALFSEEDDPDPVVAGVHSDADSFGYDYRLLSDIAEGRARAEQGTGDWQSAYPWLARAAGHDCAVVEAYDFGYGPAHFLTPDEVAEVARGLRTEHWDLDDLLPFFTRAAAEGRAVLGGVS
ncbi:hypothetical protein ABZ464_22370 [Streptomyces sp. NPDC005820]|uniref:hypothetical protein n=1 Tax=Streptomyces sp. NPDC005820 TaxID=3157069 RepID=UPI0033DF0B96